MGQLPPRVLQFCTFPWVAPLHIQCLCELSYCCKIAGSGKFPHFFLLDISFVTLMSWISWAKSQQRRSGTRATRLRVKERRQGSSTGGISKALSGAWAWATSWCWWDPTQRLTTHLPHLGLAIWEVSLVVFWLFCSLSQLIKYSHPPSVLCCIFVFTGNVYSMSLKSCTCVAHAKYEHSVSETFNYGAGSSQNILIVNPGIWQWVVKIFGCWEHIINS